MKYCFFLFALSACGTADSLYHDPDYKKRPLLDVSLMQDDKARLTQEAIQRLLASRVEIPPKAKLAVYPLRRVTMEIDDPRSYEFVQAQKECLQELQRPIALTGRLSEITLMPRLLTPADPSLTRLREVAAVMQADLLLVYEARSELVTSPGFLFFSKDEVKVGTSLELVLIDVKTGVVPYAEAFESLHTESESGGDDRIQETQKRAEKVGTLKALGKAGAALADFFKR
jgi:hypothetical protein